MALPITDNHRGLFSAYAIFNNAFFGVAFCSEREPVEVFLSYDIVYTFMEVFVVTFTGVIYYTNK